MSTLEQEHPVTVIVPSGGWQPINWREIWRSRELMYFFVWRNLKTRYKQTVLGGAWAVLQPLATMAIFTVVLGRVAAVHPERGSVSDTTPYWLFVFSGMLAWTFFANTLGMASQSVVGGSNLVTKIYFPRLIIPVTAAGVPIVDLVVSLVLLLVLMLCVGIVPGWSDFLVPVFVLGLTVAALGLGIFLSALAVAYRDVSSILTFAIQLWMFATPTIYLQRYQSVHRSTLATVLAAQPGPGSHPQLPTGPARGPVRSV